jgi:hypothetical protein
MNIELIQSIVNDPSFRIVEVGIVTAALSYLFRCTRTINRNVGTVCDVLNVHMMNQIKIENRLNEHEEMLAHMAKMRAAKAAKRAKKAA